MKKMLLILQELIIFFIWVPYEIYWSWRYGRMWTKIEDMPKETLERHRGQARDIFDELRYKGKTGDEKFEIYFKGWMGHIEQEIKLLNSDRVKAAKQRMFGTNDNT